MTKGPLKDAVDRMTEWVRANEGLIAQKVGEWVAFIVDNFKDIVKWAKRIGIAIGVFVTFAAVLKSLIAVMTVVNLLMMANPITLWAMGIALAIALLVPLLVAFAKNWDRIRTAFVGFLMTVSDGFESLPGWAKAAFFLLTGPVTKIALLAAIVVKHWDPLKDYFRDLWADIVTIFDFALEKIMPIVDKIVGAAQKVGGIAKRIGGALSTDSGQDLTRIEGTIGAGVVSPQEQIARTVDEAITTSRAEVILKDETGRAQVAGGGELPAGITLATSGAF
jgi:hypothetical protein